MVPTAVAKGAFLGATAATLIFVLLACGTRPSGLLAKGPFTSNFYDAQAHALLHGRLSVASSVTFFEGFGTGRNSQMYFGIFPAILRLPIAALTHRLDGRLTQLSMLIAFSISLWATSRLAWRARQLIRPDVPPSNLDAVVLGWFVFAIGVSSPLLSLGSRSVVYQESGIWGIALSLVFLDQLLGLLEQWKYSRLLWASVIAAFAISTRATVGAIGLGGLGVAALWMLLRRRDVVVALALGVACLLPFAAYASVNQARFGELITVPWDKQGFTQVNANRQAVLRANGGGLFSPTYVPTTLLQYLRPDAIRPQILFPWLNFPRSTKVVGNVRMDVVERSSSLSNMAPLFVLLSLVGAWRLFSCKPGPLRHWRVASMGAMLGVVGTLTIASIANRYVADFVPLVVMASALGLWIVVGMLVRAARVFRWMGVTACVLLTLLGLTTTLALSLLSQRLYLFPSDRGRADFVKLQYRVQDRIGAPISSTARLATDVPRFDHSLREKLIVLTDCAGVYWGANDQWVPVELGPGRLWTLRGSVSTGISPLLVGHRWQIETAMVGHRVAVRYRAADGLTRTGDQPPSNQTVPKTATLTVQVDPVGHKIDVSIGNRKLLDLSDVDTSGPITPGTAWSQEPVATPFCRRTAQRLSPG